MEENNTASLPGETEVPENFVLVESETIPVIFPGQTCQLKMFHGWMQ